LLGILVDHDYVFAAIIEIGIADLWRLQLGAGIG